MKVWPEITDAAYKLGNTTNAAAAHTQNAAHATAWLGFIARQTGTRM